MTKPKRSAIIPILAEWAESNGLDAATVRDIRDVADRIVDQMRGLEPLLSHAEASKMLGLHPETLARHRRAGRVPAYTDSQGSRPRWRYKKEDLLKWAEAHHASHFGR